MEVDQILCMNGGDGETSYANNSLLQKEVMLMTRPILEESIRDLYSSCFPECLRLADFGCSSGPNTLVLVWEIIDIIDATCRRLNRKEPMLQVFLTDLPGNDFNTIFSTLLPSFYHRIKKGKGSDFGPCFISATPGSFYGRLFPDNALHFAHSSYSLHWRSQVPEGLVAESGFPLNKGNIYITKTSPPSVLQAYLDLFKEDFTSFLRSRSKEMILGGRMVLTMHAGTRNRNINNSSSSINYFGNSIVLEILGFTLNDMVAEGLIEEAKLDCFNMPYYAPSLQEVRDVIQEEGSFTINRIEIFKVDWDANYEDNGSKNLRSDKHERGRYVAMSIRAVVEPILASHFGTEIMDDLFVRFAKKIEEYSDTEEEKGQYTNMTISMTKV